MFLFSQNIAMDSLMKSTYWWLNAKGVLLHPFCIESSICTSDIQMLVLSIVAYRDTYHIVTSVSRYVSYRDLPVSWHPYSEAILYDKGKLSQ